MALDCQSAFNDEMAVLNAINSNSSKISATTSEIKDIAAKILTALKPSSTSPAPVGLEAKIDETNRLLKILCQNLVGKE